MTVLFNNFVSGLDKDTECTHSMFAYSTKLDSSVDLLEGRKTLKLDWWAEFNCISTKLHARSCTWIRITMCKDTGRVKSDWNATQYKRTWGVPVNCLLNSSQQCTQDPEKPKNIMAFIRNVMAIVKLIVPLYLVLLRAHLKKYVQYWVPHFKKDIKLLECTERRAMKLLKHLENKS